MDKQLEKLEHRVEKLEDKYDSDSDECEGSGLLDPLINKNFSNKVKQMLNIYGDMPIVKLDVIKNVVNPAITSTLNLLANKNYDKLYHLGLIVYFSNGKSVILEKQSSIVISTNYTLKNRELKNVSIPQGLTLNTLIKTVYDKVGSKLFLYSGYNNNCQNFVINILQTNNLLNDELRSYVKQDTDDIFRNSNVRRVVNTVTDIGGVYDNLVDTFNTVKDTVFNKKQENQYDIKKTDTLDGLDENKIIGEGLEIISHHYNMKHPALESDLFPRNPQSFAQVHLTHQIPIGRGLYAGSGCGVSPHSRSPITDPSLLGSGLSPHSRSPVTDPSLMDDMEGGMLPALSSIARRLTGSSSSRVGVENEPVEPGPFRRGVNQLFHRITFGPEPPPDTPRTIVREEMLRRRERDEERHRQYDAERNARGRGLKPHMVKGSAEAKAWGAKMRALRKK